MPYVIIGMATACILLAVLVFAVKERRSSRDTDEVDGGVRQEIVEDAPKVIVSAEPISFCAVISTLSLTDERLPRSVYELEATLKEGKVYGSYKSRIKDGKVDFEAEATFMNELHSVILRHDLAQNNGYSYRVSGLPDMYGSTLSVEYASGESLYFSNNQSMIIPLEAAIEFIMLFEEAAGAKEACLPWHDLTVSRSHQVFSHCFNMELLPDSEGNMLLYGYCFGEDGREYRSEDGIPVSESAMEALRGLRLESLPKKNLRPRPHAADMPVRGLTLTLIDGKIVEKELDETTLERVSGILSEEFKRTL